MAIVREEDEETLVCVEGLVFLGKIGLKKEASLQVGSILIDRRFVILLD